MSQTISLNVNYNKYCDKDNNKKHSELFPNSIRMIIAGSSGCGKTNLMINFLLGGVLDLDDVIVYTTTSHQKLYEFLRKYYDELKKLHSIKHHIVKFYTPEDNIMNPSELDPNKTHIIIFDDVMNESNQKVMTDYFTKGRHNNINVFYLCQSLHQLKKHGIRQNANIFVLFRQDNKTLKYFYETEISCDMDFDEFEKFCNDAWLEKHGYVVINLWEEPEFGRYMQNYRSVYTPQKYSKIF